VSSLLFIAFWGSMKSKKGLGTGIHISSVSGNLILKAEKNVGLGEPIYDGKGRKIGIVFDIFGPVSSPFIAVKATVASPERYVGEPLFSGKS